jgi:hypothetical protein
LLDLARGAEAEAGAGEAAATPDYTNEYASSDIVEESRHMGRDGDWDYANETRRVYISGSVTHYTYELCTSASASTVLHQNVMRLGA